MRWNVRAGDGATVGDVLARAGADERAIGEGRVFVGRRRVRRRDEAVRVGDEVSVGPEAAAPAGAIPVLLHDPDMVVVDKPAGIPTIPDTAGSSHALLPRVAAQLGLDPTRLHPTSRLDRDVSGVVVFAASEAGAAHLRRAREEGRYDRRYLALASRAPVPPSGAWDAPIGRAPDPRRRAVGGRDPVPALTRYASVGVCPSGVALLAVAPVTGRTHQIRVHVAHAGAPLLGDRAYGGPARLTLPSGATRDLRRVALHAARVVIPRVRGEGTVEVAAPLPELLVEWWSALGGDAAAWEGALACVLP